MLANLISRALSSPGMSVSIGAVDGVLSSDASISDIVISDRQGPWLKVDKARLVWNRLALFSRRLEVDQLTIGHVEFLRRPLAPETPPTDTGAQQPILPELPVKVIIKQFGGAGVLARRAGRRRRGSPRHFRQGDARAAVRGSRSHPDRAAARRAGRLQGAADLHSRRRSAHPQREFRRAGWRTFRPSRQPARTAAGQARPQWLGRAGQFHGEARLQRGRRRLGERTGHRRAAGRRAAADARSQLAPRGACASASSSRSSPARRRSRATCSSTTIRASPCPAACISCRPRRDSISKAASLRRTCLISRSTPGAIPGSTAIGKLDLNASINGPLVEPDDRRRFRRRADPRRGRIGRPGRGELPRQSRWSADGREDANPVREPGLA